MLYAKRKRGGKAKTKASKSGGKKKARNKKSSPKKRATARMKKVTPKRKARKEKRPSATKKPAIASDETFLGRVTHYFPNVKAGAMIIEKGALKVGDIIHIKGHTTDFKQKVKSVQIDRVPIHQGQVGDEVGILVKSRVRVHDNVYLAKR